MTTKRKPKENLRKGNDKMFKAFLLVLKGFSLISLVIFELSGPADLYTVFLGPSRAAHSLAQHLDKNPVAHLTKNLARYQARNYNLRQNQVQTIRLSVVFVFSTHLLLGVIVLF